MITYSLYEGNGKPVRTFTKSEINAMLKDDEKIDFRKISGYAKPVKINGKCVLVTRN